ncbi:hypothetical protein MTO96_001967 [Rhipicephalus appendiculatus]
MKTNCGFIWYDQHKRRAYASLSSYEGGLVSSTIVPRLVLLLQACPYSSQPGYSGVHSRDKNTGKTREDFPRVPQRPAESFGITIHAVPSVLNYRNPELHGLSGPLMHAAELSPRGTLTLQAFLSSL